MTQACSGLGKTQGKGGGGGAFTTEESLSLLRDELIRVIYSSQGHHF